MVKNTPDRYLVLGEPIAHSLSPNIHTAFAKQTGENLVYQARLCPKAHFSDCLKSEILQGAQGFNITVPLKEVAYQAADTLSQEAKEAKAVNTLQLLADGRLYGHNTDGLGFIRDFLNNCSGQIEGQNVLILGAGGAVRGILGPLLRERPQSVLLANRTKSKAEALEAEFDSKLLQASGLDEVPATPFDLVIQGTAAGLEQSVPQVPAEVIAPTTQCYDLIYSIQNQTPFLSWARQQGAEACFDGLGMLVEQAAESFLLWRGVRPETEAVLKMLRG